MESEGEKRIIKGRHNRSKIPTTKSDNNQM